jgi:hypothetical protein
MHALLDGYREMDAAAEIDAIRAVVDSRRVRQFPATDRRWAA